MAGAVEVSDSPLADDVQPVTETSTSTAPTLNSTLRPTRHGRQPPATRTSITSPSPILLRWHGRHDDPTTTPRGPGVRYFAEKPGFVVKSVYHDVLGTGQSGAALVDARSDRTKAENSVPESIRVICTSSGTLTPQRPEGAS